MESPQVLAAPEEQSPVNTESPPDFNADQIQLLLATIDHLSDHLELDGQLKSVQQQRAVLLDEHHKQATGRVVIAAQKVGAFGRISCDAPGGCL
jgi:hypothetical protein